MAETMTREEAIVGSLELYVDRVGDPAPEIYSRFFARHPAAEELFGNDEDGYLKARMMDRVFMMLMDVSSGTLPAHVSAYWVTDHVAWDVSHEMMKDMFAIIVEVLRDGVGEGWTDEIQAAWDSLYGAMMPHVAREVEESTAIKSSIPSILLRLENLRENRWDPAVHAAQVAQPARGG